ncbi:MULTISPECIES: helix-turn-helix domain-containing protein [unclassified Microbispora]|uniref:helix-turn-helix domain-containing protein n=1 Tax=unclassified Microbispora TaxID=2614687 RepID=UPI0016038CAA|nr:MULTISPECIES: helix-turn-helix transcriptional regulator [unclassified Microbispora]
MGLLDDLESHNELAALLRALREEACLTQEELAERSGVSVRAISDLERGRTKRPHRKSVSLLAEALMLEADASERFRQVARRQAAGAPATPARPHIAVGTPPVGECPPKGVSQPATAELIEWMYQVLVEQPTRQRGRDEVGSSGPRVVQLVGGSGVDKAAVIVQASARFRKYFPDGQFYVNAEGGARGPAGLVSSLSRVFGVGSRHPGTLVDQTMTLQAMFRSRRALVVLDNVADAAEVRPLLATDGNCAVIVIAQNRLDLFEGVWTVGFCPRDRSGDTQPVLLRTG